MNNVMTGKLLTLLLTTGVVFCTCAEEWTDPDTDYRWTYYVNGDGTAEICGVYQDFYDYYYYDETGYSQDVIVIPSIVGEHGGKFVTSIGNLAFSGHGMTGVIIPEGVRRIGEGAFSNCHALRNVSFPNSVACIGVAAFSECGLESVTIPGRVTSLANNTFGNCTSLKSVTIPNSVTRIGDYAFQGCSSLRGVTIPNSVTHIGDSAFSSCSALTSVTVPGSVLAIGAYAFSWCYNLENITVADGVASIGDNAFDNCSHLTRIVIPNSVTSLGNAAFSYCENLTSVVMLNGAMEIKEGVLHGGMASQFGGCPAIRNVTVPHTIGFTTLRYCFPDSYMNITNVVVLDGTTMIYDEAFVGCSSLQSVTLPPSVMQIGNRAFAGCSSLNKVVFEGSAPDVGTNIYDETSSSLVSYVNAGSIGWAGMTSTELPEQWNNRDIAYIGTSASGNGNGGGNSISNVFVSLCVTNVVVHYVLNSVVPEIAMPVSGDVGFVTVVTEIKGGTVAVSESWTTNYPGFTEKFGCEFSAALTKPSGKRDSQGNALMVWQDYVAGTDPTDENDVFRASITLIDGVPQVSYTPELPEAEKAKRKYTTYGKARLQDEEWHVVDGDAVNYNFFKVTVEMR